jgi:hypothetical protein
MNKTTKSVLAVLVLGITVMSACKKSDSNKSTHDKIVGSWKIAQIYVDTNGNGVQDAGELLTDTSLAHQILQFNANATVITTYYGIPVSQATWSLSNNDTYLNLLDTSSGSNPDHISIQSITSNSLVLKDTSDATEWIYLTK